MGLWLWGCNEWQCCILPLCLHVAMGCGLYMQQGNDDGDCIHALYALVSGWKWVRKCHFQVCRSTHLRNKQQTHPVIPIFSILQATESWAGPGNKATNEVSKDAQICDTYYVHALLSYMFWSRNWFAGKKNRLIRSATIDTSHTKPLLYIYSY